MSRRPTFRPPTRPGEILVEEFLRPMGLTQAEVARAISVSSQRLNEVARGHRELTASMALRLARYLGTTPGFWLDLQRNCDIHDTLQTEGAAIEAIEPVAV